MPAPQSNSSQVTIVTGAAQGIGRQIAATLAAEQFHVVLADIQDVKVRAVAAELVETGLSASSAEVDVCDPDSVRQMVAQTVDRHGRIDVLINDAAIDAPPGLEWEETDEHWNRIIDTDLSGAWWCTKSVIPHMIRARRGRIIFISSVSARVGDLRTSVAYNAAKAGLIGLTIGLSLQLERYGILVNAIAPGATGNTGQPVQTEERVEFERMFPLGFGGPEPIARACSYLVGDGGAWISGSVLNVSGGEYRG